MTPTHTNPFVGGERSIETFRDSQTPEAQRSSWRDLVNVTAHRRGNHEAIKETRANLTATAADDFTAVILVAN